MITMEFEDIRKIWDVQNNRPLYVINEEALHNRIRARKRYAGRMAHINEIGLIAISFITGIILWIIDEHSYYTYLIIVVLMSIAAYTVYGRICRKKRDRQFDRSVLDDLNHAIANVNYRLNRAKTFAWWYLLPVAIPTLLNMLVNDVLLWKIFLISCCFVLAYLVVRWEVNRVHIPEKRQLENLREKLMQEFDKNMDKID